jgi:1-acyl-sn-glycerol-3-phosphate acyltransferase
VIRTVIWVILAAILLLIHFPVFFVLWLFRDKSDEAGPNKAAEKVFRPPVRFMQWVAGVRVEVEGMENLPEGGALYVGNHQGYFDALVAILYLGPMKCLLLKKSIAKLPVVNICVDLLASIPIDRENARDSLAGILKAAKKLAAGRDVLIFPEGTRSRGPEMGEFKHGAFKAALKSKCVIAPYAIDGSYKCYEEHKRLVPGTIKVSVLPPIRPEEYEGMRAPELGEMIKQRIQTELDRMRA